MFKFVFQNGEFLSDQSSILGISIDTIFTVFTTIIIFITGYIVNKRIEADKERRRLTEVKEYFLKLIELLEKPARRQSDGLMKLSKQLKEKKEQNFFVDDIVGFQVQHIKEIDNKDLLKIFISNKKIANNSSIEAFGKFRSRIYYMDRVKRMLETDLNDLMNKYDKYVSKYKENIKATSELLVTIYELGQGGWFLGYPFW